MIEPGIIILWLGTNASIPSGYARETSLDDTYPRGVPDSVTDPDDTGGAATHTHEMSGAAHSANHHTHTVSFANSSPNPDGGQNYTGGNGVEGQHSHTATSSTTSGSTNTHSYTSGAEDNDPPYKTVIYIRSLGYNFVPDEAAVFWNEATEPTGFNRCDGETYNPGDPDEYTVPDYRGMYLKGAGTGNDAGDTGGGYAHIHSLTHGHTASHSHTGTTSSISGNQFNAVDGTGFTRNDHQHTFTLDARTDSLNNYTGSSNSNDPVQGNIEPPYKNIELVQNNSGSSLLPKGIIAMWLGTLDSIPVGWNLCDGTNGTPDLRDRFMKVDDTTGDLGNTGGFSTHTHAAVSHGHTVNSASHTNHTLNATQTQTVGQRNKASSSDGNVQYYNHSHSLSSEGSGTISYANQDTSFDTVSHIPPYRTAAYIQYEFSVGGAALFALA